MQSKKPLVVSLATLSFIACVAGCAGNSVEHPEDLASVTEDDARLIVLPTGERQIVGPESAPHGLESFVPVVTASGIAPSSAAKVVIMMGRKRSRQAS